MCIRDRPSTNPAPKSEPKPDPAPKPSSVPNPHLQSRYVPLPYADPDPEHDAFWPGLSREGAIERLSMKKEGSFLLRPSSNAPHIATSYVISCNPQKIDHSVIYKTDNKFSDDENGQNAYESLDDVIARLRHHVHPVKRK
eukprot:TRINITY_DN978_c0_g1_i1.p1 TRINITY_DN978_c0_g1~~TRINITY_DN978_c0_g1_i1.p1  ORF type:complete len:140 (-),score=16.90 TRINITY_DN978_c0_g1_i1:41-460(-)